MSNVAGKPHPGRDLSAPWRLAAIVALAASVAAFAAGATALAQVSAQQPLPAAVKIPALGSAKFAWLALGVDWLDAPAGLGRGPGSFARNGDNLVCALVIVPITVPNTTPMTRGFVRLPI